MKTMAKIDQCRHSLSLAHHKGEGGGGRCNLDNEINISLERFKKERRGVGIQIIEPAVQMSHADDADAL
jgi:hypothetical protein